MLTCWWWQNLYCTNNASLDLWVLKAETSLGSGWAITPVPWGLAKGKELSDSAFFTPQILPTLSVPDDNGV